ncbi:uncharacterized protein A4U43_C02F5010 [Asparagus officinalis]|uniref:Leucine-rich repeat-containing N-terminal plant-type domain-containing protein n=1 Tax=Asparagus officinalis TaxID=4686 RepID=A0A5P1FK24_ASPOF|nr:uncharacterized protein A4U43_C02F5010 [Asparagus officinalis]
MESGGQCFLLQTILWLVLSGRCYSSHLDVQCLMTLQRSLIDPDNNLKYSWNFENTTEGVICNFNGVECWHPDENKVLSLRLSNMNLQGKFPAGLENCYSLTVLDLSNNKFTGPIPDDISKRIPSAASLNLSYNGFSGNIPSNLSNCSYLNTLDLQHNQLTGTIPWQISTLKSIDNF